LTEYQILAIVLITDCHDFALQGVQLKISGYWLASGILGVTGSIMCRVKDSGADAVVTKSIGKVARRGHPGPVLATSHGGLLNAVGLTNPGIDNFAEEMKILSQSKVPVVLSVFGSSVEEIVEVAGKGADLKPAAIELNLSCPHAEIGQIAHSPELTYDYVKSVKDVVSCPIYAKITPNASDIVSVGQSAEKAGADAVVAINTVRGMKIDIRQRRPVLGNKVGGFSGPPIFPIAVRVVYELKQSLAVPIIGVGGVTSWEDAVEMHLAGASAIQIGTALLSGMTIFKEIKMGVEQYLKKEGFSDVSEIIGLAGEI
jgi:dihydroorotate dehydrogenase (NAD+) catalytic subunit